MRALTKFAPILALALFGAVTVHAQAPNPAPPAETPAPEVAGTAADAPNVVLSPAEMQADVAKLLGQMEEDASQVLHYKEIARKQKDVIKLNCVNDRLMQIKAQRNIADSTNDRLQASLGKGGEDASGHHSSLLETSQAVRRLREEANACVGEPELFKQESGVEVTRPDIPDDPTVDNPFDLGTDLVEVEPPGYASPFF